MKKRKKELCDLAKGILRDGVIDAQEALEFTDWLYSLEPLPDLDDVMALKRALVDHCAGALKKGQLKMTAEQAVRNIDRIGDILFSCLRYRENQAEAENSGTEVHFKNLWSKVEKEIDKAERTIDIAAYALTFDPMRDLLIRKARGREGLRIRILTEDSTLAQAGSDAKKLSENRIAVRTDGPETLMHHKFIIIDQGLVINGSMNFTRSGINHNYENIMIATNPEIVNLFCNEFEQLWTMGTPLV